MLPCCQNPSLSTFGALEGSFIFDSTPKSPLGKNARCMLIPTGEHHRGLPLLVSVVYRYRIKTLLVVQSHIEKHSVTTINRHHQFSTPYIYHSKNNIVEYYFMENKKLAYVINNQPATFSTD